MMNVYSKYVLLAFFFIVIFSGCSSSKQTSESRDEQILTINPEDYLITETTAFSITDTTHIQKEIESKLEVARQHYVSALEYYESEDSTNSVKEFEEAIKILDQLSYYPDIENNEEFGELSKSLIEDYEKLIISIDELAPETPIFALREKINTEAELIDINKEVIPIPKELPKTQVPLVINEPVKQFISYFMDRGQRFIPNWFYRSGYYFPMMKRIFAEEGLPQELIYLSLVESGLNPTARSVASAVGLWQFIRSTGKQYGLTGDFWIDYRRDPEKATRAAAQHLKDLYDIYQDWYLVLAAYNSGGGRVNSAIRRARSNDFWEIAHRLPKETRGYVPQYIAISLIFMNPEEYGFTNLQYAKPYECDTIMINGCYDLEVLAEAAKINAEELRLVNADLVQGCTPPTTVYPLKLPKDKTEVFKTNFPHISPEKRRTYLVHIVHKGETVASIAKKYKISKSLLAELNGIENYSKSKKRLPKGMGVKIPLRQNSMLAASMPAPNNSNNTIPDENSENGSEEPQSEAENNKKDKLQGESEKVKVVYRVRSGDNLKSVASLYDVRISDIRNWNDIPFGQEISEMDSIDIWISNSRLAQYQNINDLNSTEKVKLVSTKNTLQRENEKGWFSHKVRSGETLGSIANKYDVTLKSLKKWNGLKRDKISKGKVLKVYGQSPSTELYASSKKSTNKSNPDGVHVIQKNETLHSIAKKNSVTVRQILEWNNLNETDKIKAGQTLKLSAAAKSDQALAKKESLSTKPTTTETALDFSNYKVKKGDNLSSIAEAYGVSVQDIKNWNNIEGNNIKIGSSLKLQANIASSSKGDNSKPKTTGKKEYYKVKNGDTLYGISKKFKVAVSELKQWNKIKSLKAGERIVVYR